MKPVVRSLLACALSLIGTSALATHFVTVIDPVTGQQRLVVMSGVGATPVGTGQDNPPSAISPTQSLTVQPSPQTGRSGIEVIDLADFINAASPAIIETLLRNKAAIDQENQDFINRQRNAMSGTGQPAPADQPDPEVLARNLDNMVNSLLQQALKNQSSTSPSTPSSSPDSGNGAQQSPQEQARINALLSSVQAEQQRRELANNLPGSKGVNQPDNLRPDAPADNGVVADVLMQQIANNMQEQARPLQQALDNAMNTAPSPEAARNAMAALNELTQAATNQAIQSALQNPERPVPGLDRTAGVAPEAERQRLQQQLEERRQQQAQQQEQKRQEAAEKNQQLLERLQNERQKLEEANQQAQQEKQQEATDRFLQQLTAAERERFLQQRDEHQTQERQPQTAPPPSASPTAPRSGTAGNTPPSANTAARSYDDAIQALYVAYFQRPADPQTLQLWQDALTNSQNSELGPILNAFASSAESQGLPSGSSPSEIINNIYLSLFGRPADSGGLPFWTDALNQSQQDDAKQAAAQAFANSLTPSQTSLLQLDAALQEAVKKVVSGPLINEYDPWGQYIYVADQKFTTNLADTNIYNGMIATYAGKINGEVGGEAVDGDLLMTFDLTPNDTRLTLGSMTFRDRNNTTLIMELQDGGFGSEAAFKGTLTSETNGAFGRELAYEGSRFNGNLFGTNAEQVGGSWKVVFEGEGSDVHNGGVFAGKR